jgi:hyperosmotically inducible protein
MKIQANTICLSVCLGLATAGMVTTFTGCAGDRYTRSTGEYIDDKSIDARVKEALSSNGEYRFNDVQVVSFKGTVQLSGFVETRDQKSSASDITKNVQGVRDVQDNITVQSDIQRSTDQVRDDKELASRVSRALQDNPDYKFDEVSVLAVNGTVQLSGFVDTSDQKSRAADIAKGIDGAKDVDNNITVKEKLASNGQP